MAQPKQGETTHKDLGCNEGSTGRETAKARQGAGEVSGGEEEGFRERKARGRGRETEAQ